MSLRTYSELIQLETFEERFRYLSLQGVVGQETFGYDRYLNQQFYTSHQWRQLRHHIIVRDEGCDMAVPGEEIHGRIIIHHMNPITVDEVIHNDSAIMDPEFLITVRLDTHNQIHYGDERQLPRSFVERRPGDTTPWRRAV